MTISDVIPLLLLLLAQDNVIVRQINPAESGEPEAPIEQLSKPGEANVETGPVKSVDATADLMPQLSDADTDVEFARVEGMDRCSAELLSAADAEFCAQRLETRSAEFTTVKRPKLSAEQLLIGEGFAAVGDGDVAERSRTIGRRDARPDDRDLQALASITLGPTTTVEEPSSEDGATGLPSETQALIEAIVERLGDPSGGGK